MGDKTIRNWERELPSLSDDGVRRRVALARDFENRALRPGAGHNPKAARLWREKLRQAEGELDRRGLAR